MENRALGKGLSALIPEKILEESKDSVSYVDLNLIEYNSLQPRKNYDEAKINELKDRMTGLIRMKTCFFGRHTKILMKYWTKNYN